MPRAARRRALGQHFLIDAEVADRTVQLAGLEPGTTVLEIGPGRGALTDRLLAAGHRVVAVELDPELASALEARQDPRLTIVRGDALRIDLAALPAGPLPVVANLPYSTGTAIVTRLLEHPERFPRLVVMLQLEVAERLCAPPGSRSYGSLTVLSALHAEATFGFLVPPRAFAPPPQVDSAVVRLDAVATPRAAVDDEALFRRVVRTAFSQRRKTLRNALASGFGGATAEALLAAAEIDPRRRAETLSLDEFARLTTAAATHARTRATGAADA
ncbi:MAG: 16S rRNA (adenine(1518)-N(6)/adenine(1519)-N(6))-dimethyltransferase RsmA [Thermodesulfobacteriota bacterium]